MNTVWPSYMTKSPLRVLCFCSQPRLTDVVPCPFQGCQGQRSAGLIFFYLCKRYAILTCRHICNPLIFMVRYYNTIKASLCIQTYEIHSLRCRNLRCICSDISITNIAFSTEVHKLVKGRATVHVSFLAGKKCSAM